MNQILIVLMTTLLCGCATAISSEQREKNTTPEKALKVYYEAINGFDREKLYETMDFPSKESLANFNFGKKQGECEDRYKIIKKVVYDKETLKREVKKNKGDNWEKDNVAIGDVFIVTSTTIKCNDGYLHTENFYYWLRRFDGVWKIYSHTSDSDD